MRRTEHSDENYSILFRKITECEPYEYQLSVAHLLFAGRNVVLRAPTGAGKTWALLAPFFADQWLAPPSRLIYALPLRTLANGIYEEARRTAGKLGKPLEPRIENGRETVSPFVTLQTGEQPDDPFFDRGRIIVTTYDQLLSGLLCGPFSLTERLHNVNAAAIAGALVAFDEFHLMPPSKAFITAVAAMRLFRGLCQSVWMTATATAPLEQLLHCVLNTVAVPAGEAEQSAMLSSLPSVACVNRALFVESHPLTAEGIIAKHSSRSIAIVNTVGRAQALFRELRDKLLDSPQIKLLMLHSRFFKTDRAKLESKLRELFRKNAGGSSILVATQVVEAGIDISCEHLHTELCPMNSLAQRAGRCARYEGESGTVHLYPLPDSPNSWLPYGDLDHPDETMAATWQILSTESNTRLDPARMAVGQPRPRFRRRTSYS
jgi:CRISPR-associated endonuclease/helicase Cas3